MTLIIVLVLAGIIEVVTIGRLHEAMGTNNLVLFYLGTTAIGALVAWTSYDKVKEIKEKTNFSNKLSKRFEKGELSEKDQHALASMLFIVTYYLGCILIAIPGLVTDILGVLFVIPPINSAITSRWGNKAFKSYYGTKKK